VTAILSVIVPFGGGPSAAGSHYLIWVNVSNFFAFLVIAGLSGAIQCP
jgi:hypothetical protein